MKTLHDGFKNNYSFVKDNKSIIFIQPREIKSERSEKKKVIKKKKKRDELHERKENEVLREKISK
jgi:hypothetical protein